MDTQVFKLSRIVLSSRKLRYVYFWTKSCNGVNDMAIRSQLLKGVLDGCVLAMIEKEEIYGYELSQKLQAYGLMGISEGTIYPVLLRLQKSNWIVGTMRPSENGPNRKYYSLTNEGKENLELIRSEWDLLNVPITKILRGDKDASNC